MTKNNIKNMNTLTQVRQAIQDLTDAKFKYDILSTVARHVTVIFGVYSYQDTDETYYTKKECNLKKERCLAKLREREQNLALYTTGLSISFREHKDSIERDKRIAENNKRKSVVFIHDHKRNAIHFTNTMLDMSIGFDMWISLDSGRTLFENVELILKGIKEAHNLTDISIQTRGDFHTDYIAIYNRYEG